MFLSYTLHSQWHEWCHTMMCGVTVTSHAWCCWVFVVVWIIEAQQIKAFHVKESWVSSVMMFSWSRVVCKCSIFFRSKHNSVDFLRITDYLFQVEMIVMSVCIRALGVCEYLIGHSLKVWRSCSVHGADGNCVFVPDVSPPVSLSIYRSDEKDTGHLIRVH